MMERDSGLVLLLGGEPRIAIPTASSLRAHGLEVLLALVRTDEPRVPSRALSRVVRLHDLVPSGGTLKDAVLLLAASEGVDAVLPLTDSALALVGQCHAELAATTRVLCPPPAVVNGVLDKQVTLAAAQRVGIRVPRHYTLDSLESLYLQRKEIDFPVIAKPRDKRSGSDFKMRYFSQFDELASAFASDAGFGRRHLVQEYVPGAGIGIGILLHRNAPVAVFQHRRLKETPAAGGVSVLAVAEAPSRELVEKSVQLLRELEWEGAAMVEFRGSADAAWLMEVNGRLWGASSLALHAGLNLPYFLWQIAHGVTPAVPRYRVGTRWRWSAGYLQRWHDLARQSDAAMPGRPSLASDLLASVADFRPSIASAFTPSGEWLPSKLEVLLQLGRLCRTLARALVGRVLPTRLKRALRIWRDLAPRARKAYVRRRLASRLPGRARWEPSPERLCRRITFVCHGNIMRSAFAAALLQAELRRLGIEGVRVTSCGTDAQSGRQADNRAIALAREYGVGLDQHLASRVTRTAIDESDVVIAMDFVNEAKLIAAFPDASRKILILPRAPRERGPVEIRDPYDGNVDDLRACFNVVHRRVKHLVNQLAQVRSIPNGSANLTTPLSAAGG